MPSTRLAPGPRSCADRCGVAYEALQGWASCGGLKVQTLGVPWPGGPVGRSGLASLTRLPYETGLCS
jgi:hypothetical protein